MSKNGEAHFSAGDAWRSALALRAEADPSFARSLDTADGAQALETALEELVGEMAPLLLGTILENGPETLAANRAMRHEFEEKIREVWGEALDLFETFVGICLEVGDDVNRRLKDLPERASDHSFEALVRLHARSCLVAQEILRLMQSGYASGAHSRWRTMHELSVAAVFIHVSGDEIALRYLDHDDIQRYKAALALKTHAAALGEQPPTEAELDELLARRNELCATYGSDFANDYGWAASAMSGSGRSFAEVEDAVGMKFLRPYYKMASHAIHPNARGSFFDLGSNDDETLIAGPSTRGLADPGGSTCISLYNSTCQFVAEGPDLDDLLALRVLEQLLRKVLDAFQAAHDEHERRSEGSGIP